MKTAINRLFIIGSEWLYVKVYTGSKSSNKLLCGVIKELVEELKRKEIDLFFYIRYLDIDYHLRLRFHIKDKGSYLTVMEKINHKMSPLVNSGLIKNIICDTYNREIERYYPELIESVESLFSIDSESIIRLLSIASKQKDILYISIKLVDQYMSLFNLSVEEKLEFSEIHSVSFMEEFKIKDKSSYRRQFNENYRIYRNYISEILRKVQREERIDKEIAKRENDLESCILTLNQYFRNSQRNKKKKFLSSIIHMSLNRLYFSNNRVNEFIIYYYLTKAFDSILKNTKDER